MFNLVIQDTLISPLILLFDFLNPHDYLPGSAIGPSLESLLFHGEIFESLFEIEVTKYYHVFRLAINVVISKYFDVVYTLNHATVGGGLPSTSNWM